MPAELRADARRNRDQILVAARALFVEQGVSAPMEEIARRAGVGIGTLYRRFPDRTALVLAVSVYSIDHMTGLARTACDEEPDAWTALCRFIRECAKLRLGALKSVVDPELHQMIRRDPAVVGARQVLMDLVQTMVSTAQRDGVLRSDVGAGDVAMLVSQHLRQPVELPSALVELADDRLVELMLDGLRTPSPSPLPGRPITLADFEPCATPDR